MTPAAIAEAAVPSTELPQQPVPTVLMVDDEPSVLSALRRLFRPQGYRILQATSGADALVLLREHAVDVVMPDMRMPEMDGARLMELVRQHDSGIARILLTGYADIAATIAAIAAISLGAIHRYIAKPWDNHALLLVVQEALERRQLDRHNAELTDLVRVQNERLRASNRTLEARIAARTSELQQVNDMLEAFYAELDNTTMVAVNVFSALLGARIVAPASEHDGLLNGSLSNRSLRCKRSIGCNPRKTGLARYYLLRPEVDSVLLGIARRCSALAGFTAMPSAAHAPSRQGPERARQMVLGGVDTRYERRLVEAMPAKADKSIKAHALTPGIVLEGDRVSSQGVIFWSAGYVFDERIIKQISDFSRREGVHLALHVRHEALRQDAALSPPELSKETA